MTTCRDSMSTHAISGALLFSAMLGTGPTRSLWLRLPQSLFTRPDCPRSRTPSLRYLRRISLVGAAAARERVRWRRRRCYRRRPSYIGLPVHSPVDAHGPRGAAVDCRWSWAAQPSRRDRSAGRALMCALASAAMRAGTSVVNVRTLLSPALLHTVPSAVARLPILHPRCRSAYGRLHSVAERLAFVLPPPRGRRTTPCQISPGSSSADSGRGAKAHGSPDRSPEALGTASSFPRPAHG